MAPRYSERLDFLMRLTDTSNSALARELSFDASYVCRIRNGKRGMPLRQPFIEPAAAYLARRIREPYQVHAVEQVLGMPGRWPDSPDRAAFVLASWMSGEGSTSSAQVSAILEAISKQPRPAAAMEIDATGQGGSSARAAVSAQGACYGIGDEGKRAMTERFLVDLVSSGLPYELLLYSDERMDWLTGDPAFTDRWASLLLKLLENGSNVSIVHTVTRDLGEMLDAVKNWLPLYFTGQVTSFYCPRVRDGICRRTLFVAKGASVVSSNSVGSFADDSVTMLQDDPRIVEAHTHELLHLMSLCKPLTSTCRIDDAQALEATFEGFMRGEERPTVFYGAPGEGLVGMVREMAGTHVAEIVGSLAERGSAVCSEKVPREMVAVLGNGESCAFIRLVKPQIVIVVSERFVTAAVEEYLCR